MRAVMDQSEWTQLLSAASDVVERKSPSFAASCTLLDVQPDGAVRAVATDLTITVASHGTATSAREGTWLLPAKELYERIRACPEGKVEVKVDKAGAGGASVKGGKRKFTISSLDSREFPHVARLAAEQVDIEITAGALARLITAVEFAIHPDVAGSFHSCRLRFGGDQVTAEGMTNAGMATAWSSLPGVATAEALVSLKATTAIRKLASAEGESDLVRITIAGTMMRVVFASTELVFPLMAVQMPDLYRLAEPSAKFVVNRDALADSLKSASVSVDLGIHLKSTGSELVIHGRGQHGEVTDSIACEGDACETWLPPRDLILALGTLQGERAEVGVGDVVRIIDAGGEGDVRHIRMPMREGSR